MPTNNSTSDTEAVKRRGSKGLFFRPLHTTPIINTTAHGSNTIPRRHGDVEDPAASLLISDARDTSHETSSTTSASDTQQDSQDSIKITIPPLTADLKRKLAALSDEELAEGLHTIRSAFIALDAPQKAEKTNIFGKVRKFCSAVFAQKHNITITAIPENIAELVELPEIVQQYIKGSLKNKIATGIANAYFSAATVAGPATNINSLNTFSERLALMLPLTLIPSITTITVDTIDHNAETTNEMLKYWLHNLAVVLLQERIRRLIHNSGLMNAEEIADSLFNEEVSVDPLEPYLTSFFDELKSLSQLKGLETTSNFHPSRLLNFLKSQYGGAGAAGGLSAMLYYLWPKKEDDELTNLAYILPVSFILTFYWVVLRFWYQAKKQDIVNSMKTAHMFLENEFLYLLDKLIPFLKNPRAAPILAAQGQIRQQKQELEELATDLAALYEEVEAGSAESNSKLTAWQSKFETFFANLTSTQIHSQALEQGSNLRQPGPHNV